MSALQRCRGLGAVWLNKNLYLNLFMWLTYIVVFSFWETMCRNGKTIPQKTIAVAIFFAILWTLCWQEPAPDIEVFATSWKSKLVNDCYHLVFCVYHLCSHKYDYRKRTLELEHITPLLNYLISAERQTPCMDCRKNHVVSFYVWMRIKLRSKYFNQPKTANIETLPMITMAKGSIIVFYCLCHKCETKAWRVCFALTVYFNQYN